jgi:hypothetical protein
MRGVSVRGAGGLLIGVVLQPILTVLNNPAAVVDDGIVEAFRRVFWVPGGYSPPADTAAFFVLRGLLVFGGLALGALAVVGVRPVRFPLALLSAVLAVGILPWVVWPYDPVQFRDVPPDWILDHPLWFLSTRGAALLYIALLVAAVVLAVTDSGLAPSPARAAAPAPHGAYGTGSGQWPAAGPAVTVLVPTDASAPGGAPGATRAPGAGAPGADGAEARAGATGGRPAPPAAVPAVPPPPPPPPAPPAATAHDAPAAVPPAAVPPAAGAPATGGRAEEEDGVGPEPLPPEDDGPRQPRTPF